MLLSTACFRSSTVSLVMSRSANGTTFIRSLEVFSVERMVVCMGSPSRFV